MREIIKSWKNIKMMNFFNHYTDRLVAVSADDIYYNIDVPLYCESVYEYDGGKYNTYDIDEAIKQIWQNEEIFSLRYK